MIKLICFVRRKPGMSADEFHRYWREQHGPLVARTTSGSHVLRYEQNPRIRSEHDRDDDGYDGVTEQWFASVDDFYASLREPDYADIEADIEKFLDPARLVWILTEEPNVVIPGP